MEAIGNVMVVGCWVRWLLAVECNWLLGFVILVVVASKIVGLRRERGKKNKKKLIKKEYLNNVVKKIKVLLWNIF